MKTKRMLVLQLKYIAGVALWISTASSVAIIWCYVLVKIEEDYHLTGLGLLIMFLGLACIIGLLSSLFGDWVKKDAAELRQLIKDRREHKRLKALAKIGHQNPA